MNFTICESKIWGKSCPDCGLWLELTNDSNDATDGKSMGRTKKRNVISFVTDRRQLLIRFTVLMDFKDVSSGFH